ncbi:MAG: NAD(P)H-dependent oxidoreductase [Propionibacteriaceae bacterium]|nr:NAD(P)H-dependent oxidoreductase [Propionibacteriaceae bacterium]
MSRTIVIVSAGMGNPSTTRLLADRITDAVRARISARGEGVQVTHVELRHLLTDLATTMATGMASPRLEEAFGALRAADGVAVVTPVFTASYSGVFKLFFDVMDKDLLEGKPVLLAATAGTARHSLVIDHAMRPLFAYLRADIVPTGVFAATDDFAGAEELSARIYRAADELVVRAVAERGSVGGFTATEADLRSGGLREPAGFAALLKGRTGTR